MLPQRCSRRLRVTLRCVCLRAFTSSSARMASAWIPPMHHTHGCSGRSVYGGAIPTNGSPLITVKLHQPNTPHRPEPIHSLHTASQLRISIRDNAVRALTYIHTPVPLQQPILNHLTRCMLLSVALVTLRSTSSLPRLWWQAAGSSSVYCW
jgi:hypothetical protein